MTDSTRRPHHNDDLLDVIRQQALHLDRITGERDRLRAGARRLRDNLVVRYVPTAEIVQHLDTLLAADPTFDTEPTVHGQPAHTHHAHTCAICRTKENAR